MTLVHLHYYQVAIDTTSTAATVADASIAVAPADDAAGAAATAALTSDVTVVRAIDIFSF